MTLAASSRYAKYEPVVSTDTFLVSFPLFDDDDLRVVVDGLETEAYSVTATYVDRVSVDAAVVLSTAVSDVDVEIYGARTPRRENSYLGNSPSLADNLQHDADVLTAAQQEITREAERMLRLPVGSSISPYLPALPPGTTIIVNDGGDGFSIGPSADEISGANQSAIDAEAAAVRAEAAENSLLEWQGQWVTATLYSQSDLVSESGNTYVCIEEHTSGTFATDLGNSKWEIFAQKGTAGAGSGDMLNSENLSGLTDKPLAFSTIKQAASTTSTGVVEKATTAEMSAGTSDKYPDAAGVKAYLDGLPFWHYEDELAYTAAGQVLTFTHSMGTIPAITQIDLVCTATDAGYAVGDVIHDISSATTGANDRGHDAGFSLYSVDANVMKFEVAYRGLQIRSKAGGSGSIAVAATPGKWKVVLRARLSGALSGLTATVADGDMGDIVVSGGGTTWTVDTGAITLSQMADLPAGRIIGRIGSSGVPQALTGAEARGALGVLGETFPDIATLAIQPDLADGAAYTVTTAANGQPETFTYNASSTATADGALIVTATGMGVGRLVAKRTVYATVAEMLADRRTFADGVYHEAGGVRYVTVSSGARVTNAGGQGYKISTALDYYTPSMFGGVPGTMTDYRDEIEACIAAAFADKKAVMLDGLYRASTVRITQRGVVMFSPDPYQCGIYPVASTTDDTLQISNAGVQIKDIGINSLGGGAGIAVRGGTKVLIEGCVFLDRSNDTGVAILLDDRNPAGTFVAGAYAHRIINNDMYQSGYYFNQCIKTQGTSGGMNNCEIVRNQMAADGDVIYIHGGGGNRIRGNYIKSGTGLPGAGLRVGKGVNSLNGLQFVEGNYFENLEYALFDRSETRWVGSNHMDNCDNYWGLSYGSRNPPFAVGDKGVHSIAIESLEGDTGQFYSLTGNGQALPVRARLRVSGNGANRTGCTLSTTGARDGMLMWLEGTSWPFELIESTTADFGQDAGVNMWFGSDGTTVSGLGNSRTGYERALFMYSNAKWRLLYAQRKAPTSGNFKQHVAAGSTETVDVGGVRTIYLNANGANRDNNTLTAPITDGQRLTLIGSGYRYQILHSSLVKLAGGANANVGTAATQLYTLELVGRAGVWYEVSRAAV